MSSTTIQEDKDVIIHLKDWQVPRLLGALRLGILLEDWCASIVQNSINTFDHHSERWTSSVDYIAEQIAEQTGVMDEETEYASSAVLKYIGKWVGAECKRLIEDALNRDTAARED